ncbi:restriction endonuclease subunit S, partial [Enterococcus faecalis]|uniref:restriction endonuclease subunit S n=1 Tax=Enterococcus faecalis TaxID=1351 RepID=UPI003D6A3F67
DIMNILSGVRLTTSNMIQGEIPFVGASDSNNGITNWISNTNSSSDKNVLGINYNGSVGEVFYHPYIATFSDDVKRLKLKYSVQSSKEIY